MKKNKYKFIFGFFKLLKIIFKKILIIIFFPLYLFIFKVIKSNSSILKKILKTLLIFFVVAPFSFLIDIIILGLFIASFLYFGFLRFPNEIVGSSMLPTLIDHQYLFTHSYNFMFWKPKLDRGDIVLFEDDKTNGKTYVKRIIAIEGESIELRDGSVYINGNPIDEQYVYKYKSTFGGAFLSECKKAIVPKGNVFVLGDNRTRSSDSREIGFVRVSDIHSFVGYDEQKEFKSRWKVQNIDSSVLNIEEYINEINKLRIQNSLKPLKLDEKLSKSADLRARMMLKFNDLSFSATISAYPMTSSMRDANYYNIAYGEYPVLGHYTATDLYNYMLEVKGVKDFMLYKDYQDIGISIVKGDLNNCPVQLILQQVAGYVPPKYNAENLSAWKTTLSKLKEVLPSWEKIKDYSLTYTNNKKDADRLLEIINLRISMMERIVYKMENKQWLTNDETSFTNQDLALFNEQETIAKKLNSFRWQH